VLGRSKGRSLLVSIWKIRFHSHPTINNAKLLRNVVTLVRNGGMAVDYDGLTIIKLPKLLYIICLNHTSQYEQSTARTPQDRLPIFFSCAWSHNWNFFLLYFFPWPYLRVVNGPSKAMDLFVKFHWSHRLIFCYYKHLAVSIFFSQSCLAVSSFSRVRNSWRTHLFCFIRSKHLRT